MHASRPEGPDPHDADAQLRAVTRAVGHAAAVLEPGLVLAGACEAAVLHLGAVRADVWTFERRRTVHVASAGCTDEDLGLRLQQLPSSVARGARAMGVSQVGPELFTGDAGRAWAALLDRLGADSVDVFPVVSGDRVIGALTTVGDETPFPRSAETMASFIAQVAATFEKAQLHRAAQDAAMTLRVQNRVLSELADERDVPSLRAAVEVLAADVLGDVAVALLPIDSLGRLTVPVFSAPSDGLLRVASEPEIDVAAPALEASGAVALQRPGLRTCAALGLSALAGREQLDDGSVWGIALRRGDQTTGVLLVGLLDDGDARARADRIHMVVSALAPPVAIALENAQLFAREHVRASRLAAANSLARTVATCSTRDELHDALCVGGRALFGFARIAVYGPDLQTLTDHGHPGRRVQHERTLVSTAMHRRRVSRVERHDRTCIALPLLAGGQVHSVLYIEQPDSVTPEQEYDDMALLESMCEHAAACLVAIEATEKLERTYLDTIQSLVHALEARDQYTADHSDVVAEWAVETGRRIGMNDDDLRDLELGAILHDIGKVAVPDSILNKPDRLTADEFEVMKSHTVVGERILGPIGFLANVAPIVRHEHERWDGRGYPDGISGTDIPLASRIIFVCDTYHAITSDRPYRSGQSHAFARKIVIENAGTQFDPAVASVFLDVIDDWCLNNGINATGDEAGEEIVNPLGALAKPGQERVQAEPDEADEAIAS